MTRRLPAPTPLGWALLFVLLLFLLVFLAGLALGARGARAQEADPLEAAALAVASQEGSMEPSGSPWATPTPEPTPTEAPRYRPSARSGRPAAQELVEASFPPAWVPWAMTTARCESGYDLYAYSAGFDRRWGVWYEHVGLLQVDGVSWRRKARELYGGDFLDPVVNAAMAAWIVTTLGPGHWPYCGRAS